MIDNLSKQIKKLNDKLQDKISEQRKIQESERLDTLDTLFNVFMELDEYQKLKKSVYLHEGLLKITIKSYFDDIYRYKLYASSELADKDKKSAYLIKWIAKIRPIQILPDVNFTEKLAGINSAFAVFVGLVFLEIKPDSDLMIMIKNNGIYNELLYNANFREINSKQLSSLMKILLCFANDMLPTK